MMSVRAAAMLLSAAFLFSTAFAAEPVATLDFGRKDGSWSVTRHPDVQVMEVSALSDNWVCRGAGQAYNLFCWRPSGLKTDQQYTLTVRARSFSGSNALSILLMKRGAEGKVVEGEYPAHGVVLANGFREYRFPFNTKGIEPVCLNFYLGAKTDPDKGIDIGSVKILEGLQTQMEIFPIFRGQRLSRAAGKLPVKGTEIECRRNAYGQSARPIKVLAITSDERGIRTIQEVFEGLASALDVLAGTGLDQDTYNTDSDPDAVRKRLDAGEYDLYVVDNNTCKCIGKLMATKILGHVRNGAGLFLDFSGGWGEVLKFHFAEAATVATSTAWNDANPFPYADNRHIREGLFGKGRVLHADIRGLKIRPPASRAGVSAFPYQRFADAWLAKAFLYAAGRESYAPTDVTAVKSLVFNQDAQGRAKGEGKDVKSALAAAEKSLSTAGAHWVFHRMVNAAGETVDCQFEEIDLPGPMISAFEAVADSVKGNEPARFRFDSLAGSKVRAVWSLEDFSGRVIERGEAKPDTEIVVPTTSLFTNLGIFKLRLMEGKKLRDSRTAPVIAKDRDAARLMNDFTVSIWPARTMLSSEAEAATHAALLEAGLRHSLIINTDAPYMALRAGLGVGTVNLGSFEHFGAHPQASNVRNNKPINTESARAAFAADARRLMKKIERYGVVGGFLCDEPGLVERNSATEPDETPENVEEFKRRMAAKYGPAGAKLAPVHLADARASGKFAGYIEWRNFNVDRWCEAIKVVSDAAHEVDPDLKLSLFNSFGQTAASGNDYWKLLTKAGLDHSNEYTSLVYFGDRPIYNFDEFYRSFRPDMRVWGFTGYGLKRPQIHFTPWWFAAHRYGGFTWFSVWTWEYQFLDIPTLARTLDAQALAEDLEESQLTDGLGALMLAYDWAPRQIALYYSHESMLVSTLLGTETLSYDVAESGPLHDYMFSRQGLERTLEGLLHQYDYVAPEQVTNGVLNQYKVLILPRIRALSNAEIAALKAFVAKGGKILADELPGAYDELGRKRPTLPFAEKDIKILGANFDEKNLDCRKQVLQFLAENKVSQVLGCKDILKVEGREAMRLTDGTNSLYVVLRMPGRSEDDAEQKFDFPTDGFVYDVRTAQAFGRKRSISAKVPLAGAACWSVCAGQASGFEVPLPATIARGSDLQTTIRLNVASGPAGTRLFRVRLIRPDGTSGLQFERKLTAADGVCDFKFRMAFNDQKGQWTLAVKDVLTGLEESFGFNVK